MTVTPFDRQPEESAKAFAAFVAYRNLPPRQRSLLAAYRLREGCADAKHVPGRWNVWSRAHAWVQRAAAYDAERDRAHREQEANDRRERLERRTKLAGALAATAIRALNELRPERVSATAAVHMLKVAAELEDSAWEGALELEQLREAGAVDRGSYDILDSLRADPALAPLVVHLQDEGIDLECGRDG